MNFFKHWRFPANWAVFRSDDRLLLMLIAIIVGIFSGLAALTLNRSLEAIFELLHHLRHYWWAFVLPGTGAALSLSFFKKNYAGRGRSRRA